MEPLYMMAPPGGDVLARVGFSPASSERPSTPTPPCARRATTGSASKSSTRRVCCTLVGADATLWGVPAAERARHRTLHARQEVFDKGCTESRAAPPRLARTALPHQPDPLRSAA